MPALSFSGTPKRGPFWKLVQNGEKTITTRKPRKNPIKEGDTLYLYWKQRVPKAQKPIHKIGQATCTKATVYHNLYSMLLSLGSKGTVDYLKKEGFDNLGELITWWTGDTTPSYGIMNGGLMLDQDTIDAFLDEGPIQVIEFSLNSQQLRKSDPVVSATADEPKTAKPENLSPPQAERKRRKKKNVRKGV